MSVTSRRALVIACTVGATAPAVGAQTFEDFGAQQRCLAENEGPTEDVRRQRDARVRERPTLAITGLAGGYLGVDFNAGLGGEASLSGTGANRSLSTALGGHYTLLARADVMVLHPLWITGQVRWFGAGALMFDATAGLNFRSYGNRWVGAGATAVGRSVVAWNAHCQLRRNDVHIVGGVKGIVFTGTANSPLQPEHTFALQLGVEGRFERPGGGIGWGVQALFDPGHMDFGGQFNMSTRGLFGTPRWFYFGMEAGAIIGQGAWMTLDLGASVTL